MKNGTIILILVGCFIFGFAYGMNSDSINKAPTRGDVVKQEIDQYETALSNPNSDVLSVSTRDTQNTEVSADNQDGVNHNNISKFGQDAGEMLKTGVREVLRFLVQACDKLISE